MPTFDSSGLELFYLDQGEGEPIVLVHGFASNLDVNWVATSWVQTLVRAGRRVVAIDNRGHGKSEKVYDPLFYTVPLMAQDVARLMEHLRIGRADVMGYSMGARIAAFLARNRPELVRSVVFGGAATNLLRGTGMGPEIAAALEAADPEGILEPTPRMFRNFAERTGGDLKALAACMRSPRAVLTAADLQALVLPILVAVGSEDTIAGSPHELAALLPTAEVLVIPGRDHNRAVGDRVYKEGVLAFLAARP